MTRFARAKGSKASNERVPEEATPWNEMKQQLLEKNKYIAESKNRQEAIDQRNSNYRAFLEERELEVSRKSQWAQFPTDDVENTSVSDKKKKRIYISQVSEKSDELSDNDESFLALRAKVDEVLDKKEISKRSNDNDVAPEDLSSKIELDEPPPKIKKLKKKKLSIPSIINTSSNEPNEEESKTKVHVQLDDPAPNIKKLKKKKLSIPSINNTTSNDPNEEESKTKPKKRKNEDNEKNKESKKRKESENKVNASPKNKIDKKVKKPKEKVQPKKIIKENLTEQDIKKLEKKKQKRLKQIEKKKMGKLLKKQEEEAEKEKLANGETETINNLAQNVEIHSKTEYQQKFGSHNVENHSKTEHKHKFGPQNEENNNSKFEKPNNRFEKNKKFSKARDDKEHKRRKPPLPTKMFINGKEVEVDYVDGFPVKKEDATRLKKLRKEMISKGLPRSEINIALKLERRKAEKAFSREKKKVCFNCRKSGHNLSECPDLEKDQISHAGTGICFKCGSTEHTHFECKVVRGQEFKYAQCFICNEQGHIARQCPDNARGLYPKGGSCKVCGDVTHLKKDCPKYQAQQQQLQNSFSAETISDKPDDLDINTDNRSNFEAGIKRPNKIIKF